MEHPENMEPVKKLTRDILAASRSLSQDEARFLVDNYYAMQGQRIRAGNQVRSMIESGEPNEILQWYAEQSDCLEDEVAKALGRYAKESKTGQWALSICGIGPVITAGLLAHIDIEKCPTVGHIWRFAGLDPTSKWNKGEKRPWNAALKTLCWKIGESFVKVKGRDSDVYGKVYAQRKAEEQEKNIKGDFAEQAAAVLESRPSHIQKATYKEGKLPDGHIHARAKRYTVKLFLSHFHHVYHVNHFGVEPPKPYIIEHGGHVHFIKPPNWPMD